MVEIDNDTARSIINFYTAGYSRCGRTGLAAIKVATHTLDGQCPDFSGDARRDPGCPACQTLVTVEKALASSPESADPFDKILEGKW